MESHENLDQLDRDLVALGAVALAIELQARSIDHLEATGADGAGATGAGSSMAGAAVGLLK